MANINPISFALQRGATGGSGQSDPRSFLGNAALSQALNPGPIVHPAQGFAQLANAALASKLLGDARAEEQARESGVQSTLAAAFRNAQGRPAETVPGGPGSGGEPINFNAQEPGGLDAFLQTLGTNPDTAGTAAHVKLARLLKGEEPPERKTFPDNLGATRFLDTGELVPGETAVAPPAPPPIPTGFRTTESGDFEAVPGGPADSRTVRRLKSAADLGDRSGGPLPVTSVPGVLGNALIKERGLIEAGSTVPPDLKRLADLARMDAFKRSSQWTDPSTGITYQLPAQTAAQFGFGGAGGVPANAAEAQAAGGVPVSSETTQQAGPASTAPLPSGATGPAGSTQISGPKPLPVDASRGIAMSEAGISQLDDAKKLLFAADGSLNRRIVAELKSGFPVSDEARQFEVFIKRAINNKLRLESGAAVPETEVDREFDQTLPGLLDSPETALIRLDGLGLTMREFLSTQNRQGAQPPETDEQGRRVFQWGETE